MKLKVKKYILVLIFLSSGLLSGCSIFKKGCDCPTFGKKKSIPDKHVAKLNEQELGDNS